METYYYDEHDTFADLSEQVAELNRRLDNLTRGSSGVHATQSPFVNYDSFGGHHSFNWGTSNFDSEQYVGNFNSQYNYPNSDFYDSGWPNHSNFYWQQEQEQIPQWGAENYLPNYQIQTQSHHQPQVEEDLSLLEDMLKQMYSQWETHFKTMEVSFKNIEVYMDQIARASEIESQESVLNDTENNLVQESKDDCDDVEIMVEDEVEDVVEKSIELEEFVKPTQSTEITIVPIGVENESEVYDFTEYINEIGTKPRPQQKRKKKSKFQPNERGKHHKEKGNQWADRKILDDHLRLCRRGLLFKARKRLRRNTFNTRWRFTMKSS